MTTERHFVYYLLAEGSRELLYIGRSTDPARRKRAFQNRTGRRTVFGLPQRFTSFDAACAAELEAIAKHRPPYNRSMQSGRGSLGMTHAAISRARIAEAKLGNPSWSGRKHGEETLARMSAAQAGHPTSPETRAKIAASLRGRTLSAEHRAKIKTGLRKHHSPETEV